MVSNRSKEIFSFAFRIMLIIALFTNYIYCQDKYPKIKLVGLKNSYSNEDSINFMLVNNTNDTLFVIIGFDNLVNKRWINLFDDIYKIKLNSPNTVSIIKPKGQIKINWLKKNVEEKILNIDSLHNIDSLNIIDSFTESSFYRFSFHWGKNIKELKKVFFSKKIQIYQKHAKIKLQRR